MLPRQLRIPLCHLDIRMAENLRKLVKITAIHHVPRRKSVTQIMKAEVFDLGPYE
jgi:hypothetical protein